MCEALLELMKEEIEASKAESIAKGEAKGVNMINTLNIRLINENRLEDLKRTAFDEEYQKKLLGELKLLDK